MTEDFGFNRMTPAEQAIWRTEQVAKEEREFQAKMKRQSELQLLRTESFTKAKAQAQLVADTILKNLRLSLVVGGEARVGSFQAGLVQEAGVTRGHLWSVHGPGCGHFDDVPGGLVRVRELFEVVQHPRDLTPFKETGEVNCQRHYANHPSVLLFRGLKLDDLNVAPCACVKGLHQYQNVSTSFLSLSPWSIEPGQEFDCLPGAEEGIEAYLKIGYLEDLRNPKKVVPKEEEAKPKTSEEILEEAISHWEEDDD